MQHLSEAGELPKVGLLGDVQQPGDEIVLPGLELKVRCQLEDKMFGLLAGHISKNSLNWYRCSCTAPPFSLLCFLAPTLS